jgi:hypothetical protein
MGQKHLGITVNRLELVCHKSILPATTIEIRETRICNTPSNVEKFSQPENPSAKPRRQLTPARQDPSN